MHTLWLSSYRLTTVVTVAKDIIVESHAPITRKFTGQPISNLVTWLARQGGLITHKYEECWIVPDEPAEVDLTTSYNIMVTGHRKLGTNTPPECYDPNSLVARRVWEMLCEELEHHLTPPDGKRLVGISGMALGVDQLWCDALNHLHVPWVAFIPCLRQDRKWPPAGQERYRRLLESAAGRMYPNGQVPYSPAAMHDRNRHMVSNSDLVLAVWDGTQGGTANAVAHAADAKLPIRRLDPTDLDAGWFPLHPAGAFSVESSTP